APPTGQAPAFPARPLALPWPAPRRPPRPALARAPARLAERACETPRALRRRLACPWRPRRAMAQPSQRAQDGAGLARGPARQAERACETPRALRRRMACPSRPRRAKPQPSQRAHWRCPGPLLGAFPGVRWPVLLRDWLSAPARLRARSGGGCPALGVADGPWPSLP